MCLLSLKGAGAIEAERRKGPAGSGGGGQGSGGGALWGSSTGRSLSIMRSDGCFRTWSLLDLMKALPLQSIGLLEE